MSAIASTVPSTPATRIRANTITQYFRNAKKERTGILIAVADNSAPLGFRIGWSKCDLTPKKITLTAPNGTTQYTKVVPTDPFNVEEGTRVAKRRLSGEPAKIASDIQSKVSNERYIKQYNKFLFQAMKHFTLA